MDKRGRNVRKRGGVKPDRRVRRTRTVLREAMKDLILEKGYPAITVEDLVERADVARSSFYQHFRGKEDLLLGGFQDVLEEMPGDFFAGGTADAPALGLPLFEHIGENRELARTMIGTDTWQLVQGNLGNVLLLQAREWLHARGAGADAELHAQHMVGALMTLVVWWVRRDFPLSPREISDRYTRLCLSGLPGR